MDCRYSDISGARKQRYVGPDDTDTRRWIEEFQHSQEAVREIIAERQRLVAMIVAGGATPEKGRAARIIEKLADAGVFDAGEC